MLRGTTNPTGAQKIPNFNVRTVTGKVIRVFFPFLGGGYCNRNARKRNEKGKEVGVVYVVVTWQGN